MPGQILADLAALGRDMGKSTRRHNAGGGKKTERMAAIDHGNIRWEARSRRRRC
jgi:hypothetical protein